jgi:hypothetical protein
MRLGFRTALRRRREGMKTLIGGFYEDRDGGRRGRPRRTGNGARPLPRAPARSG